MFVIYLAWYIAGGIGAALLAGGLTWAAIKWREARRRRRAAADRTRPPTPLLLARMEEGAIQALEGAAAIAAEVGPFRHPIPLHPSNPFYGDVVGAVTPPLPRVPEEVEEDEDEDEFFDW